MLVFGAVKVRGGVLYTIVTRMGAGDDSEGWTRLKQPANVFQTEACAADGIDLIAEVAREPDRRFGVARITIDGTISSIRNYEPLRSK